MAQLGQEAALAAVGEDAAFTQVALIAFGGDVAGGCRK